MTEDIRSYYKTKNRFGPSDMNSDSKRAIETRDFI